MPAQENSLDDLIAQMLANRTEVLEKQEERTARVGQEAGLAPAGDSDDAADDDDINDDDDAGSYDADDDDDAGSYAADDD